MVAAIGLSLSDAIILAAVLAGGLKVLADYRGWTRSPALVRQENADLRERNATLAAEVERLDKADREKGEQIASMQRELDLLRERDQAAVLEAISAHEASVAAMGADTRAWQRDHEQAAQRRADATLAVLKEIRDRIQPREGST